MSDPTGSPLASLELLRKITDRHVLDQLLTGQRLTRAEIAARTGISKPTISESVRRLEESGVIGEAGEQQGRRGRAGLYYDLRPDIGFALAVSAGPGGVLAETRDIRGHLLRRVERDTPNPVTASQLNPVLRRVVRDALADAVGPLRGAALSIAGPVDRETGRLVRLPNSPYLVDALYPRRLLGPLVGSNLVIDNDVNWAAVAEHRVGVAADLADFVYCYLGHGIGGAVVRGGQPVVGRTGLAGEIAHVLTAGPRGRTLRLVECFGVLGLLVGASDAIDVDRVRSVLHGRSVADRRVRDALVVAVAGMIASLTAVLNPDGVVIGGPWGGAADFSERVATQVGEQAVIRTEVRPAGLGPEAPLIGAGLVAVGVAQESVLGPTGRGAGG